MHICHDVNAIDKILLCLRYIKEHLESVHFSDEIFLPNIIALILLSSVVKEQ